MDKKEKITAPNVSPWARYHFSFSVTLSTPCWLERPGLSACGCPLPPLNTPVYALTRLSVHVPSCQQKANEVVAFGLIVCRFDDFFVCFFTGLEHLELFAHCYVLSSHDSGASAMSPPSLPPPWWCEAGSGFVITGVCVDNSVDPTAPAGGLWHRATRPLQSGWMHEELPSVRRGGALD